MLILWRYLLQHMKTAGSSQSFPQLLWSFCRRCSFSKRCVCSRSLSSIKTTNIFWITSGQKHQLPFKVVHCNIKIQQLLILYIQSISEKIAHQLKTFYADTKNPCPSKDFFPSPFTVKGYNYTTATLFSNSKSIIRCETYFSHIWHHAGGLSWGAGNASSHYNGHKGSLCII